MGRWEGKGATQREKNKKKEPLSLLFRGLIASCVNHSDFFIPRAAPFRSISRRAFLYFAVDTKQVIYNRDRDGEGKDNQDARGRRGGKEGAQRLYNRPVQ